MFVPVCKCVLFREEREHKIMCPEVASGIFWSPDTCHNSQRIKKQGGGEWSVCLSEGAGSPFPVQLIS